MDRDHLAMVPSMLANQTLDLEFTYADSRWMMQCNRDLVPNKSLLHCSHPSQLIYGMEQDTDN